VFAGGAPEGVGGDAPGAAEVGDGNLATAGVGDAGAIDAWGILRGAKSSLKVPAGRTGALAEAGVGDGARLVCWVEKNVVGLGEGLEPASVVRTRSSSSKVVELGVVAANGAALF